MGKERQLTLVDSLAVGYQVESHNNHFCLFLKILIQRKRKFRASQLTQEKKEIKEENSKKKKKCDNLCEEVLWILSPILNDMITP